MPSERIQRRIDSLLDQADEAIEAGEWERARQRADDAVALDPGSVDAQAILDAAARRLGDDAGPAQPTVAPAPTQVPTAPTSFASGRYEVRDFLGEGGKKRVFLAHDTLLDRDVAFALVRTEGLDDAGRQRVQRERPSNIFRTYAEGAWPAAL